MALSNVDSKPLAGLGRRFDAARLRPGDLVEVRSPFEILQTLDGDGALDHVPFMPEMIEFCGRQFRVSRRVVKTCSSGSRSTMSAFRTDDVVLLDGLRCSGAAHDGCQKSCMIFWRESWLRKLKEGTAAAPADIAGADELRAHLKTTSGPRTYYCQASELLKATRLLSRRERFGRCLDDIRAGNCGVVEMVRRIAIWSFWRARRALLGPFPRGSRRSTPSEGLNLQPGELIEVKPLASIAGTLNEQGYNRGLYFSPDMRLLCGRHQRVKNRLDKIIVDGTGEMRQLRHTVYLEDSPCGCSHVAFGGCCRGELSYWREIWLRRV